MALLEADANARQLVGRWLTATVFLHLAFYVSGSGALVALYGHEIALVLQLTVIYSVPFSWRSLWLLFLAMIFMRFLVPGRPVPLPLSAYCVSLAVAVVNGLMATAFIRAKSPLKA